MSDLIQLDSLPVEALAAMANEAAAASLAQWEECKATGSKAVEHAARCGRALQAIKAQLPHGKWASWVEESFPFGIRRSQQFMEIAKAHARALLTNASSFQDALRLMDESPEKQQKKAEREAKKRETTLTSLAPATPAPPVSSGTIRNENPPAAPAPAAKPERPAWLADPDEMGMPDVDAMPPLPKTNTHHTAQNRRTPDARETDRIGLVTIDDPRDYVDGAWYRFDESMGRMFWVTDDAVLERAKEIGQARGLWLVFSDPKPVVERAEGTTPVVEHKRDSVSSKPGKVPTVQQLRSMVEQRANIGGHIHAWSESMVKAAQEWASYKQSLTGKAKVRSLEQWVVALSRIENTARIRGADAVCDMIEKAIANGWQGWEHETSGSRGGSRISTAVRSNRNWDEEIPEWKPTE